VIGASPARDDAEGMPSLRLRALVVDDNDIVRSVTVAMLERQGFDVIDADGPWEALELARGLDEPVDLLLTDVVMPQMNGLELADVLAERWPGLSVIYTSGHADVSIIGPGAGLAGAVFVPKPFSLEDLARATRDAAAGTKLTTELEQTGNATLKV
jgi:two-component system cell cycle sensor histidine kinase/response regulator CckA